MIRREDFEFGHDVAVFDEDHSRIVGGFRVGETMGTIHSHSYYTLHSHPSLIRPSGEMAATAGDDLAGVPLQPYQRALWSRLKRGLRSVLITPRRPQ